MEGPIVLNEATGRQYCSACLICNRNASKHAICLGQEGSDCLG